jgi:uncharacterized protein YdeI (YjbR/CyaY-like superfamily)
MKMTIYLMETKHFENRKELRKWLISNHYISNGLLIKIFKKHSMVKSISFQDLLEEGLCFGWSESKRLKGDDDYYIQVFAPRKNKGTNSKRNKMLIKKLIEEGRMTEDGLKVL